MAYTLPHERTKQRTHPSGLRGGYRVKKRSAERSVNLVRQKKPVVDVLAFASVPRRGRKKNCRDILITLKEKRRSLTGKCPGRTRGIHHVEKKKNIGTNGGQLRLRRRSRTGIHRAVVFLGGNADILTYIKRNKRGNGTQRNKYKNADDENKLGRYRETYLPFPFMIRSENGRPIVTPRCFYISNSNILSHNCLKNNLRSKKKTSRVSGGPNSTGEGT